MASDALNPTRRPPEMIVAESQFKIQKEGVKSDVFKNKMASRIISTTNMTDESITFSRK